MKSDEIKIEAAKKEADTYAVVCLVLSILTFPLMCTFFGGAILLIISVVLGIVALKDRTSRAYLVILSFILDTILLSLVGGLIYMLATFGSVTVKETSVSPLGTYQVEVIANDEGATGGYYILAFERSSEGEFASVGDKRPRDAVTISETGASWGTTYDITWVSDDTFYVLYHPRAVDNKRIRVELSEDGYMAVEE